VHQALITPALPGLPSILYNTFALQGASRRSSRNVQFNFDLEGNQRTLVSGCEWRWKGWQDVAYAAGVDIVPEIIFVKKLQMDGTSAMFDGPNNLV